MMDEGRRIFRHDSFGDVVSHYDRHLSLGLTEAQSQDLVEYLKSL